MQHHSGKIYVTAVVAFLALLLNVICHVPESVEDISKYPKLSYLEIDREIRMLQSEVDRPVTHAKQFFDMAGRIVDLRRACMRYTHDTRDLSDPRIAHATVHGHTISLIEDKNTGRVRTYRDRYWQEFAEAQKEYEAARASEPRYDVGFVGVWPFVISVLAFQFLFAPFAYLIFAVWNEEAEGSILLETCSPYFWLCVFGWQYGLFKYKAKPIKAQLRLIVQYASYLLFAALSFGGAALKAQMRKAGSEPQSGTDGHTLVVSGSTHYLPKYLGLDGAVFHPKAVLQSSLTVAEKRTGLFVNYWKSVPVEGSSANPKFAIEEDYTLGIARTGKKRGIAVSATIFNVVPLRRMVRGDLLQLSVRYMQTLPGKIGAYAWFRSVQPLKDGNPPGGCFGHLGASRGFGAVGKSSVVLEGEAVFDSGAFGYKRAGIARWAGTFKVPLGKRFTLDLPVIRMSTPFTSPRDGRKLESVVGLGLNFSLAP